MLYVQFVLSSQECAVLPKNILYVQFVLSSQKCTVLPKNILYVQFVLSSQECAMVHVLYSLHKPSNFKINIRLKPTNLVFLFYIYFYIHLLYKLTGYKIQKEQNVEKKNYHSCQNDTFPAIYVA